MIDSLNNPIVSLLSTPATLKLYTFPNDNFIIPVPSELSAHDTIPVFVVQVKTTVSPGHTGEYDGQL